MKCGGKAYSHRGSLDHRGGLAEVVDGKGTRALPHRVLRALTGGNVGNSGRILRVDE